jgi:SRSO17 transposase
MLAVIEGSLAVPRMRMPCGRSRLMSCSHQIAGVFSNAKVRRHGRSYVLGLLSQTERKNSWQLAEFAGESSPDGMHRLLLVAFRPMSTPVRSG